MLVIGRKMHERKFFLLCVILVGSQHLLNASKVAEVEYVYPIFTSKNNPSSLAPPTDISRRSETKQVSAPRGKSKTSTSQVQPVRSTSLEDQTTGLEVVSSSQSEFVLSVNLEDQTQGHKVTSVSQGESLFSANLEDQTSGPKLSDNAVHDKEFHPDDKTPISDAIVAAYNLMTSRPAAFSTIRSIQTSDTLAEASVFQPLPSYDVRQTATKNEGTEAGPVSSLAKDNIRHTTEDDILPSYLTQVPLYSAHPATPHAKVSSGVVLQASFAPAGFMTSNTPGPSSKAPRLQHALNATVLHTNFTEEGSYSSGLKFEPTPLPIVSCNQVLCQTRPRHYLVNSTFCRKNSSAFHLVSENVPSTLEVLSNTDNGMVNIFCKGTIRAPDNSSRPSVTLQLVYDVGNLRVEVCENDELQPVNNPVLLMNGAVETLYNKEIQLVFRGHVPRYMLSLMVQFVSNSIVLPSRRLSATAGFVTSPGFDKYIPNYPTNYDGTFFIKVPKSHSVWFRFNFFKVDDYDPCSLDNLTLSQVTENKTDFFVWRKCEYQFIPLTIVHNSLLLEFHSGGSKNSAPRGFKMTYAVIPNVHQLARLPTGRYNCSVPHYHELEEVFRCNLIQECEGNEDEENCEYSGQTCGVGAMEVGSKCLTLEGPVSELTWNEAHKKCQDKQQSLVRPRHYHIREALGRLQIEQNVFYAYIGLQFRQISLLPVMSAMYRHIWRWTDNTTAFTSIEVRDREQFPVYCALYFDNLRMADICNNRPSFPVHIVCEFDRPVDHVPVPIHLKNISLEESVSAYTNLTMVRCPQGHVTRKFLSCDQESQCGAKGVMTSCQVETREVAMFVCDDGRHSLPYSLVCDHIPNCLDKSDEDFCHHTPCPRTRFQCQSGQCVSPNVECNVKLDCFDGSEEKMCQYKLRTSYHYDTFSVIVELHGDGSYQTGYPPERCPPTHFPCLDGDFLPVFLRCNGIADCNGREDEENCESYACPGYYRCRNSSVCLHPHHMCDGIFHCPHFDDELLCKELTCPEACECQGLAFVCAANNFSVSAFPELRYLDVSGTAMSPGSLSNNLKLVRVSLSDTGLTVPPTLALPNLIHLDLSYNEIASVNLQAFGFLTNLRVLVLRGNPLFTFVSEALLESDIQRLQNALLSYGLVKSTDSLALRELDVSQTQIEVYNGSDFAVVPLLKHLNLSHTKLHTITDVGFKSTSKLELLDARASPVKIFPSDLLRVLADLHTVYADNFKLCCPAMLPEDFDIQNCYAAQDVLASCDALLRSNTYRVFLWIFAALSIAGNAASFVTRLYLTKRATGLGSFEVFVTNLCVADFLMGVYLTIIGAADLKYQGEYLWFDDQWKESIACSFAGYLCLLSSEVSAFIICLITLDRFIVLHYPFSRFRFRRRSALLGCSFVWSAGIILASVPLLPSTSHWRFYSQTGICIPLPFTTDMQFRGRVYSISVMIAVNFALFLLIAVGQVGIYWSVRHNSIASSSRNTTSRDAALARRLTSVVVSDFLCWFPIGLLGLLNYTGTPIPGEVNVGVAIFVLPLNSALNPFLYTFNVLMEKYRRAMRQYNSSSTKEAVLDQLKVYLASKTISITDIISAFINEETSQMEIDVAVRSLLSNKNTARHKQLSH